MIKYCEACDAYYDSETDEWTEPACDDPECEFCADRPERPSQIHRPMAMSLSHQSWKRDALHAY